MQSEMIDLTSTQLCFHLVCLVKTPCSIIAESARCLPSAHPSLAFNNQTSGSALSNTVATNHVWLSLNLTKIEVKIKFHSGSSYMSSSQQSPLVSGHHMGKWRYSTFPSSQKGLLDSRATILLWLKGCPGKMDISQPPLRYGWSMRF